MSKPRFTAHSHHTQCRVLRQLHDAVQAKLTWGVNRSHSLPVTMRHSSLMSDSTHSQDEYDHRSVLTMSAINVAYTPSFILNM